MAGDSTTADTEQPEEKEKPLGGRQKVIEHVPPEPFFEKEIGDEGTRNG